MAAKVTRVTIAGAPASAIVGDTLTLTATPIGANGKPVSGAAVAWGANNPTLGTLTAVTTTGKATLQLLAPGTVVVDATSRGVSGTATITVSAKAPPAPTPTPTPVVHTSAATITGGTGLATVTGVLDVDTKRADVYAVAGSTAPTIGSATRVVSIERPAGILGVFTITPRVFDAAAGNVAVVVIGTANDGTTYEIARAVVAVSAAPVVVPPPVVIVPPVVSTSGAPSTASIDLAPLRARFLADFKPAAETLWAAEGALWSGDYYDRAVLYGRASQIPEFSAAERAEYLRRADLCAVGYRTGYLETIEGTKADGTKYPDPYNTSPHWSQLLGVYEHYTRTKDPADATAIRGVASRLAGFLGTAYVTPKTGDGRIVARVLQAQRLAAMLAGLEGNAAARTAALANVTKAIDAIAAWVQPDGSMGFQLACGGQTNYMVAMVCDELAQTFDTVKADARIPDLIARLLDYLFAHEWRIDGSFNYTSVLCTKSPVNGESVGGPTAAPDLNAFYLPPLQWLADRGDATAAARAALVFANTVGKTWLVNSKVFNQTYSYGLRYCVGA